MTTTTGDHGKVAAVTGAGSGIGRSTVLALLKSGWRVAAADMNEQNLAALVQETDGGRLEPVVANVTVESDVAAIVGAAKERFGSFDAMVNNAGVGGAFGPISEIEQDDWDFTFDVLVRGVFFGTKYAVPALRANGGGAIVNLASVAAFNGGGGPSAYSAAKSAVVNLTQSTAVELAQDRIRVNAVAPGVIMTPLLERGLSEEAKAQAPSGQPWRRWGGPDDIAGAIVFLLSEQADFITGQTLVVDGGLLAAGPGPDFARRMGTDARHGGVVGVNRGTTGERSEVRRRLS